MAGWASSSAARVPITQAVRRRGSPGRRHAGSFVPTGRRTATTSTACANALRLEVADASPGQVDPRSGRAGPAVQDQRPLAVAGESFQSRSSPTVSLSSGRPPRASSGMQPWAKATARLHGASIAPGIVRDRKVSLSRRPGRCPRPTFWCLAAWQSLRSLSRPKGEESTVTGAR
jgi:hypothetical protein